MSENQKKSANDRESGSRDRWKGDSQDRQI